MCANYEQLSARRERPRSFAQARTMAFCAKGGEPARAAFTMAEILLSLTIIGVVAAITLPSLTGNINERTWNKQRKALYARFSQAIALMPALNGYSDSGTFVTAGLSKVLKMNNICDSEHLADCGIPDVLNPLKQNGLPDGSEGGGGVLLQWLFGAPAYAMRVEHSTSNLTAFETVNGESIVVTYNPSCVGLMDEKSYGASYKICANFIYDLNGNKGPNTFGKDIGFITALYPTDSVVVAPLPSSTSDAGNSTYTRQEGARLCTTQNSESRLPNIEELSAMYYNNSFVGLAENATYVSGSSVLTGSSRGTMTLEAAIKAESSSQANQCIDGEVCTGDGSSSVTILSNGWTHSDVEKGRVRCIKR